MLDAIARIEEYLNGVSEAQFHEKYLIQDGVIRQLEIIGEAVKNPSPEIRSQYPVVPWKDIAGMPDRLIHHYFGVDMDKLWVTATEEIPPLKTNIQSILDKLD